MTPRTGAATGDRSARLSVLESFGAVRETTNPYQAQLITALHGHMRVRMFSWRAALLGRFDVFHVHWPEVLIRDRTRVRTSARQAMFLLVLLRLRLGHRALVRTLHNTAPHEAGDVVESALLRLCDRWTTQWVRLNELTVAPTGAPVTTILHGHYRDWFDACPSLSSLPGQLLCFGRIRKYKGVPALVAALRGLADPALRLRIVGPPDDAQVAASIDAAAAADPRISATLRHVTDAETAAEFGRAELVVLPYAQMHNSGAALLALSLARPVLVPRNAVTQALAREVGPGWVLTYDGPFGSAALQAALERVRTAPPPRPPDLTRRAWDGTGLAHADVFARAVTSARSRRT